MVVTDSAHRLPVAPNLLDRRFDGWQPDQAWVADITYVPTGEGWLYLAAVMDLAGRRVGCDDMSMSRRANAWDNAPMESFFKTLKVERIHQVRYDTRMKARLDIVDWIEDWYNRQRLHTASGFLAPVTWENQQFAA